MSTPVSGVALDGPDHGQVFTGSPDIRVPAYRDGEHVGYYAWDAVRGAWAYTEYERQVKVASSEVE